MKGIKILLCGLVLLLLPFIAISCTCKPTPSVDASIVQVWEPATAAGKSSALLAFGVVVGDGSQVLTVLNYEDYTPDSLEVVLPGQGKYKASVQAIDPRTSTTLLKLEGAKRLPVAIAGNASLPEQEQEVLIWGWTGPNHATFKNSTAIVTADQAPRPLFFSVMYTGGTDVVDAPGAVVTDRKGNVLGLETTFHERLAIILGPIGRMPPIASINSARELLLPDATQRPWANGPALSVIANSSRMSGYFSGVLPSPSDYDKMTIALQDLLGKLGEPVATDDLHLNSDPLLWYQSLDGTMLIVVYPRPVDLKSTNGKVLAQAKWVGIEWHRNEGKPNRLVYGSAAYTIQGGFMLKGDISALSTAIGVAP